MNEIFRLSEVVKYTKYDRDTALVILINDVLNLHLRVASIDTLDVQIGPSSVIVNLTTKIDKDIILDGGKLYTGSCTVTYDKINISAVYPGGFLVPKWMGLESLLNTLLDETGVNINKEDCILTSAGDIRTLEILPNSLFWHGMLDIKITEPLIVIENDPTSPPGEYNPVDDLNKELFNTIAFLSAIYHNKTSH